MPKSGPKPKPIADRNSDPLGYRIRRALPARTIFDQTATSLLQCACGEAADEASFSDSED
jgi:hypothetical protein